MMGKKYIVPQRLKYYDNDFHNSNEYIITRHQRGRFIIN